MAFLLCGVDDLRGREAVVFCGISSDLAEL
jgi:hypothetical protein